MGLRLKKGKRKVKYYEVKSSVHLVDDASCLICDKRVSAKGAISPRHILALQKTGRLCICGYSLEDREILLSDLDNPIDSTYPDLQDSEK